MQRKSRGDRPIT